LTDVWHEEQYKQTPRECSKNCVSFLKIVIILTTWRADNE
jgi:hypothetical protein